VTQLRYSVWLSKRTAVQTDIVHGPLLDCRCVGYVPSGRHIGAPGQEEDHRREMAWLRRKLGSIISIPIIIHVGNLGNFRSAYHVSVRASIMGGQSWRDSTCGREREWRRETLARSRQKQWMLSLPHIKCCWVHHHTWWYGTLTASKSAETIRLALTCMHEYVWTYDEQFKKKFMDPEIT